MRLVNYLFYKKKFLLYFLAASAVAWIMKFVYHLPSSVFRVTALTVFMLVWVLRTLDDAGDYKKDAGKKKQYLSENELCAAAAVLTAAFVLINTASFGIKGTLSIVPAVYPWLWGRMEFLKPWYMALVFVYFTVMCGVFVSLQTVAGTVICILCSLIYAKFKKEKKHETDS